MYNAHQEEYIPPTARHPNDRPRYAPSMTVSAPPFVPGSNNGSTFSGRGKPMPMPFSAPPEMQQPMMYPNAHPHRSNVNRFIIC